MQRQNRPASDTLRYHGVDAATEIEEGDMLYLDTDDVKQADQLAYDTGGVDGPTRLLNTQTTFAGKFAGVAVGRHRANTDPAGVIAVQADGIWLMECASTTWEIGDKVGADDNAGATALENQKVIKVTSVGATIGTVVQREVAAVTQVWCRLTAKLGFISANVGG